jgi:hypothetical protein
LGDDKIRNGMEARLKKAQGAKTVDELEKRFLSPDQEATYNSGHKALERSGLWNKATKEQRDKVEDILYNLAAGTADGIKMRELLQDGARYGVSESEYLLYKLALSMEDKPSGNGNYGSYTNDEVEAAIDLLGLSKKESAWLWTAQGKSDKSNPYK